MNNTCRFLQILFLVSFCNFLLAQEPEYKTYNWDPKPKLHELKGSDKDIPELVLKEVQNIEYIINDEASVNYNLMHKIIKVNSDEAIERNNRIYLPLSSHAKMLVNKARVINSKGDVKELKEEDIKEGVNDETQTKYRYFALEGVDKGSEIEFLRVIEDNAEFYGRLIMIQDETPIRNFEIKITTPNHLILKTKSYNGFPKLVFTDSVKDKNILSAKMDTIAGLKKEEFAVYRPNLMQVIYKLDENKNTNKKNIINYINASQTIYDLTHEQIEKSTTKALQKLIKQIDVDKLQSEEDKIRKVENYLKMNFSFSETSNFSTIQSILDNKNTNEMGMTKLFVTIFDLLGINHQIVLTTDREKLKFDPEFEAYNFLETYLLYFPNIKKYIAPSVFPSRLGCIPFANTYNYGLFVRTVSLSDFKSGVGEVKFIEPSTFEQTQHNHYVNVDFTKSIDNPDISYKITFEGNYAESLQPIYPLIQKEKLKEFNETIFKGYLKEGVFTDIIVENGSAELLGLKPLVMKAKCTSANIVEQAGDKYLFKIGELIGPQTQLYQEEERKFDVENDFNRSYNREITFNIPAGYKITNLDAVKITTQLIEKNEPSSSFVSNYEIKDDKVIVKVFEFYKSIYYPKEKFQEFRKVVNAAADFNKVVLVLEKK